MSLVRTADFDCHYADDYFGPPWQEPEVVVVQVATITPLGSVKQYLSLERGCEPWREGDRH